MKSWMHWLASAAALVMLVGLQMGEAEASSLRFEKTLKYETRDEIQLDTEVGSVKVHWVQFLKPTESSGGLLSRLRAGDDEVTGYFKAMFDCENPQAQEWDVTFILDLLDDNGELIDRVTKKAELEGEAKRVMVEHPTLKYVLPLIKKIKIRIEAKMD